MWKRGGGTKAQRRDHRLAKLDQAPVVKRRGHELALTLPKFTSGAAVKTFELRISASCAGTNGDILGEVNVGPTANSDPIKKVADSVERPKKCGMNVFALLRLQEQVEDPV